MRVCGLCYYLVKQCRMSWAFIQESQFSNNWKKKKKTSTKWCRRTLGNTDESNRSRITSFYCIPNGMQFFSLHLFLCKLAKFEESKQVFCMCAPTHTHSLYYLMVISFSECTEFQWKSDYCEYFLRLHVV